MAALQGSFDGIATIAADSGFQGRCLHALMTAAVNVMAEVNTTAGHPQRLAFARQVIGGSVSLLYVAHAVLTNTTISAESNAATVPDFGIPDGDIQFSVNSLFNAFAGLGS